MQKEKNLELIKKLASTKVDTSLFHSSRSLGGTKPKRDILAQALNETRVGINVESNRKLLYESEDGRATSDDSEIFTGPVSINGPNLDTGVATIPTLGSGLKRSLDADASFQHVIKRRRRSEKAKPVEEADAEDSWEGFSSEPTSLTSSTGTQTDDHGFIESDSSEDESLSGESSSEDEEANRENRKERYVQGKDIGLISTLL